MTSEKEPAKIEEGTTISDGGDKYCEQLSSK
jgi:hypothetical protein